MAAVKNQVVSSQILSQKDPASRGEDQSVSESLFPLTVLPVDPLQQRDRSRGICIQSVVLAADDAVQSVSSPFIHLFLCHPKTFRVSEPIDNTDPACVIFDIAMGFRTISEPVTYSCFVNIDENSRCKGLCAHRPCVNRRSC